MIFTVTVSAVDESRIRLYIVQTYIAALKIKYQADRITAVSSTISRAFSSTNI
jgi:hypothetical protein